MIDHMNDFRENIKMHCNNLLSLMLENFTIDSKSRLKCTLEFKTINKKFVFG